MAEVIWPPTAPLRPERMSVRGGPLADRASFQTDSGIPVDRPMVTAQAKVYDIALPGMSRADFAAWEAWYRDDLRMGSRRFVWLHPMTGQFALCRILSGDPPYQESQTIKQRVAIGFKVMILPAQVTQAAYRIAGCHIEVVA